MLINYIADYVRTSEIEVYNSAINRHKDFIRSRIGTQFPAVRVEDDFFRCMQPDGNVFVDEGQFFSDGLLESATGFANRKSTGSMLVSGLDLDSDGMPFYPMNHIIVIANRVIRCRAWCEVCGKPADYTFAKFAKKGVIHVGDEEYEPRCRICWEKGQHEKVNENSRT